MRYWKVTLAGLAFGWCQIAFAQGNDELYMQLLRTVAYADTARAGFRYQCRTNTERTSMPKFRALCAKVDSIPNRVIESALLPYAKRYVSPSLARDAIAFWSSSSGRGLLVKILQEIESGRRDILGQSDLDRLDRNNKTAAGRALSALAGDAEGSQTVARAMMNYEP